MSLEAFAPPSSMQLLSGVSRVGRRHVDREVGHVVRVRRQLRDVVHQVDGDLLGEVGRGGAVLRCVVHDAVAVDTTDVQGGDGVATDRVLERTVHSVQLHLAGVPVGEVDVDAEVRAVLTLVEVVQRGGGDRGLGSLRRVTLLNGDRNGLGQVEVRERRGDVVGPRGEAAELEGGAGVRTDRAERRRLAVSADRGGVRLVVVVADAAADDAGRLTLGHTGASLSGHARAGVLRRSGGAHRADLGVDQDLDLGLERALHLLTRVSRLGDGVGGAGHRGGVVTRLDGGVHPDGSLDEVVERGGRLAGAVGAGHLDAATEVLAGDEAQVSLPGGVVHDLDLAGDPLSLGGLGGTEQALGDVAAGLLVPLVVVPQAEDVVSSLDVPGSEVVLPGRGVDHLVPEVRPDRSRTALPDDLARGHGLDLHREVHVTLTGEPNVSAVDELLVDVERVLTEDGARLHGVAVAVGAVGAGLLRVRRLGRVVRGGRGGRRRRGVRRGGLRVRRGHEAHGDREAQHHGQSHDDTAELDLHCCPPGQVGNGG